MDTCPVDWLMDFVDMKAFLSNKDNLKVSYGSNKGRTQ